MFNIALKNSRATLATDACTAQIGNLDAFTLQRFKQAFIGRYVHRFSAVGQLRLERLARVRCGKGFEMDQATAVAAIQRAAQAAAANQSSR